MGGEPAAIAGARADVLEYWKSTPYLVNFMEEDGRASAGHPVTTEPL